MQLYRGTVTSRFTFKHLPLCIFHGTVLGAFPKHALHFHCDYYYFRDRDGENLAMINTDPQVGVTANRNITAFSIAIKVPLLFLLMGLNLGTKDIQIF